MGHQNQQLQENRMLAILKKYSENNYLIPNGEILSLLFKTANMQRMKVLNYAYTGLDKKKKKKTVSKKLNDKKQCGTFFRLIFSKKNYEKIKNIKY